MAPSRSVRDDRGIALPIVMGAAVLMIILVTAGFYASSQILHEAQMADYSDTAYQAASSGVTVALADLRTKLSTLPAQMTYEGSLDASAASYVAVATLNQGKTAYECVSTGTAASGTQEVVIATFSIVAGGTGGSTGGSLWGKNIFFPGTIMGNIVASGQIRGPMYIVFPGTASQNTLDFGSAAAGLSGGPIYVKNGNLVLKQTPSVPIDIYTNGTVTLNGNAKNNPQMFLIHGWDASYEIPLVPVSQASFLANALQVSTTESSDNRMGYASSTIVNYESQPAGAPASYASIGTNPPNNRPTGWLRTRAPGASSTYKIIPGDFTLSSSTPSFGSWSGDGHYPTTSGLHDDFAYDSANHVLYVEGVVYVGGNLTFDSGSRVTYVGGGTIVCAGNVTFRSDLVPTGANGADGLPDPAPGELLGIFAKGNVVADRNGTSVVVALYAASQISVSGNNVTLKGSFIAEQGMAGFPNNLNLLAVPAVGGYAPGALPSGLTGTGGSGGTGAGTATLSITSWRRG
jgi:hypothetical protein